MGRLLPLFGFLALFALLGFGIWWNLYHETNEIPSPLIGKHAPEFTLPLLDNAQKSISEQSLRGQPYLLNVFASWCVACEEEHPVLTKYAPQLGVKLIGYNYKDSPDDAKRWLARFGNPYAITIADLPGSVAIDFGVYAAPESFLVDANGVIRYKRIGPFTAQIIEKELKPMIAKLSPDATP